MSICSNFVCSNFALIVYLPIYLFIVEDMFYSHVYMLRI